MFRFAAYFMFIYFSVNCIAQQPPVSGDDWIKLLGQRNTSADVSKVMSYTGENGNPKGLKLTIKDNILTRIDFYNDDNPWGSDIKKFQGKMPKDITLDNNIAQCKKIMGEPFEAEGEVSGTYVIHKTYEIDNSDAYQLNMEFLTGRLNAVALILQPGGAKKFTQDGKENKSGINGDDFIYLIKKSQYNKTYSDMVAAIGPPNYEERQLLIFANGGVSVDMNNQQFITGVTFYSGGQVAPKGHIPNYKGFALPMPLGIRFGDTRDDIIKKAGAPVANDASGMMYKVDYTQINITFAGEKVATLQLVENKDYKVVIPPNKPKTPKK